MKNIEEKFEAHHYLHSYLLCTSAAFCRADQFSFPPLAASNKYNATAAINATAKKKYMYVK